MIEQLDLQVQDWIRESLADTDVVLQSPSDFSRTAQGDRPVVGLYLLDISRRPQPRSSRRSPLQLSVRYLATANGADPLDEHRLLGELCFAIVQNPQLDLQEEPPPWEFWLAMGAAPRPCLVIRALVRRELPEAALPMVTQPIELRTAPMKALTGIVLGPSGAAMPDVRIELESLGISTRSDSNGRFRFATAPGGQAQETLKVKSKGRSITVQVDRSDGNEPATVRLPATEV